MKNVQNMTTKCYIHHTPGRLRIRIPSIRKNPTEAEKVKMLLSLHGINKIKANPLTGSVVVTYDMEKLSYSHLLEILKENGYYREDLTITLDSRFQDASDKAAHTVGRAVFGWALGKVLESNGLSFIAALI
jgi:hypothetical protein